MKMKDKMQWRTCFILYRLELRRRLEATLVNIAHGGMGFQRDGITNNPDCQPRQINNRHLGGDEM